MGKKVIVGSHSNTKSNSRRSSGMVSHSWSNFWYVLSGINDIIDDYSKTANNIEKISRINRFLETDSYKDFQMTSLGVFGGAFGIANDVQDTFFLLQTSKHPPAQINKDNIIDIPGLPEKATQKNAHECDYHQLVDFLFIGRRGRQPLRGETDTDERQSSFAPEFYKHFHLPSGGPYAFPYEYDETRQREKPTGQIYCSHGELLFFIYAWRLFFRFSHLKGLTHTFSCNEVNLFRSWEEIRKRDISPWKENFYSSTGAELSVEYEWINSLKELKNTNKAFHDEVDELWKKWSQVIDIEPNSESYYLSDWIYLKLIEKEKDSYKITISLLALMKYACHIALRYTLTHYRQEILLTNVQFLQEQIGKATLDDDVSLELLSKIDDALQAIAFLVFSDLSKGKKLVIDLLNVVHKIARFPIMAYFYWIAIAGGIKAHLVFPVWTTSSFPVTVRLPCGENDLCTIQSPIAGVCLLGIEPIKEMDETLPQDINMLPDKKALVSFMNTNRLNYIKTFFEKLAKPVIDKCLFGELVTNQTRTEEWENQLGQQAHEITKIVDIILGNTPSFILDEIRNYFLITFLAHFKEIKLSLLHEHKRMHDLLDLSIRQAAKTEWLRTYSTTKIGTKEEMEQRAEAVISKAVISGNLDFHIPESVRMGFYATLVCAFRNAIRHMADFSHLTILVDDKQVLIINKPQLMFNSENIGGPLEMEKKSLGTEASLRTYVKKYGGIMLAPNIIVPDERNGIWTTSLPLPDERMDKIP